MPTTDLKAFNPHGNQLAQTVVSALTQLLHLIGINNREHPDSPITIQSIEPQMPLTWATKTNDNAYKPAGVQGVEVTYTGPEGQIHTEIITLKNPLQQMEPVSVNYDLQLTEAGAIMQDSIQNPDLYNDPMSPYNDFYKQNNRMKIISDGLMRVFNKEWTASEGFIEIVKNILISSMGLKETDGKYIQITDNVRKGMGSFRFVEMDETTSNRDGTVANFIKSVQERGENIKDKLTPELMKQQIHELLILVGDYIYRYIPHIKPKAGGRKSKNRYNYAHFIPLNSNSKKSFHNGISRKVKSRRRKQYRNKHTTRRK